MVIVRAMSLVRFFVHYGTFVEHATYYCRRLLVGYFADVSAIMSLGSS